jgi:rhodanese-related sulfurtransferase
MRDTVLTVVAAAMTCLCSGCATDTSSREAHQLRRTGATLLDVRSRQEFAERHIEGSLNIPVEELKRRFDEVGPRDQPVIVYCHTGARAGFAVQMLRHAGFRRVHNLGTIGRWYKESAEAPPRLY